MTQYILIGIILALITAPLCLLVGRKFLKLSQLKLWHILLSLLAASIVGYIGLFLGFFAMAGGLGMIIFALAYGIIVSTAFHFTLKIFVTELKYGQSLLLMITILFVLFVVFLASVPIYNSIYFPAQ